MVISKNTQFGLSFIDHLKDLVPALQNGMDQDSWGVVGGRTTNYDANHLLDYLSEDSGIPKKDIVIGEGDVLRHNICFRLFGNHMGIDLYTHRNPGKCFLVASTVESCANMIRLSDNFSSIIFGKLNNGWTTFLLGANQFSRFYKKGDHVIGMFWDKENKIAFEMGFDVNLDVYYFPTHHKAAFERIARIVTFILLGDIDTVFLEPGRNNGKPRDSGKITNKSEFPISIVDSKWNKILIRTEGFGVRGHFRLQACGVNHSERKLVWINAFEKHGYTRKAGILR